jgi:hypothetical protein
MRGLAEEGDRVTLDADRADDRAKREPTLEKYRPLLNVKF